MADTVPSVTTTMTWIEDTTLNGFTKETTVTTTVVHVGGSISFVDMSLPSSWLKGTTNPDVVYLTSLTVYASPTDAHFPEASSTSVSPSTTATSNSSTAMSTTTATTTSSAAANALYGIGHAGHGVGAGLPGTVALAACFAAMGAAIFGRRL